MVPFGKPAYRRQAQDKLGSPRADVEALRIEANEHLDFAIGEFRAMKMQPSLERALRHKVAIGDSPWRELLGA